MKLTKSLSKKRFSPKKSRALPWMLKTEAKIVYTALASAFTHKLLQKTAQKYPKLKFLEQGS